MYKILVIEDETSVRQNLWELLTSEDFDVITAENGRIGVQLAQQEIPDLVICDVMMPELDGYGVLNILRQEPTTATIPLIFLTAKSDKTDLRQGMELGADDYITKPFTRAELLAAISSRLQKQVTIHQQSEKRLDELRSSITMSLPHEMRTPLNGILGFSELLMQEVNNLSRDEIREMALFIHLSGERLHRLVQNFLLYAELEIIATDSKQINQLRSQKTIFPSMALKKLMIEQAKQAKRDADLQVNFQTHCCLQICETRLYKILEELIDNALKFSESGTTIHLVSTLVSNQLIISLTDHGRGMTAAQIAELGGYRQFDRQLYEQQGLGLGLIIAKRMTELHGGELSIQSQLGEKTVVQVMLPCI